MARLAFGFKPRLRKVPVQRRAMDADGARDFLHIERGVIQHGLDYGFLFVSE